MTVKVALSLPDSVYSRARQLAELSDRDVADVLTEAIVLSLSPTGISSLQPIASLSDTEVIALTSSQMEPESDRRLSELLDKQQAGTLKESENREMWMLMQIYQTMLVRKAEALRVAVERGLREPLTP